ncbi:MAG: LysE family translocator [Syntrophomonadaceae bacterium]|nr:LysE family translocator [Syntrophomonadaceae bacterium]
MLDPHNLKLFVAAALALLLIPGPSVLYVTTRSVDQGRAAGLVSVGGIALGSATLALCAAAGLSAILASSHVAFNIVKYLGAAYLIYLGITRLLSRENLKPALVERQKLANVFMQGAVVAFLNPKTALFYLAFLPQFVDVARGHVGEQTLLLGITLVGLGICTDSIYALMASTLRNWLQRQGAMAGGQRYVSGGIYVALGVVAALAGTGKH